MGDSPIMEESTTYQGIIEKGRSQGLNQGQILGERTILIRQGTKRFGKPDAPTLDALQKITDIEKLGQLAERLLDASSWDDLLAVN